MARRSMPYNADVVWWVAWSHLRSRPFRASYGGQAGTYRDFSVWIDEDGDLGRLDGIVVDAEARRVRYLVVAAGGTFSRRRYLLPFSPTRVDANRHALCVDAHKTDLVRCAKFEPGAFHRFRTSIWSTRFSAVPVIPVHSERN